MRSQRELDSAHAAGEQLVAKDFHDTNYIFLSFVTGYLPVGALAVKEGERFLIEGKEYTL